MLRSKTQKSSRKSSLQKRLPRPLTTGTEARPRRPVSYAFVYAEWIRDDVVLRDKWEYTDSTNTWQYDER